MSATVVAKIHELRFNLLLYPLDSPDLAPSNYHLLPQLTEYHNFSRYEDDKSEFYRGIEALNHRCLDVEKKTLFHTAMFCFLFSFYRFFSPPSYMAFVSNIFKEIKEYIHTQLLCLSLWIYSLISIKISEKNSIYEGGLKSLWNENKKQNFAVWNSVFFSTSKQR